MENSKMKELFGKITLEGKEISFRQFLSGQFSDLGELFTEEYQAIINAANDKAVSWTDVDNYFCPLVDEVLVWSAQENREVYFELAAAVKSAYGKLKSRHEASEQMQEEESDQEYFLDRNKKDFFRKFDGLIHELASGRVIKEFDNQPLGSYRVVTGEPQSRGRSNERID